MYDLKQSLKDRDLGFLQIVAELWGLELNAPDARSGLQQLTPAMLNLNLINEIIDTLPPNAKEALDDLIHENGKLPWQLFSRRYGMLREIGSGRRDREQPHINPISTAEILWYRALIARAFLDSPSGPQEFAYIPSDLLAMLPKSQKRRSTPPGRIASPTERANHIPVDDRILDHITTMLAALRLGFSIEMIHPISKGWHTLKNPPAPYSLSPEFLYDLISSAQLLGEDGLPQPNETKRFLEMPRAEALTLLVDVWKQSQTLNELRHLPDLIFEGVWKNHPLQARAYIIDFINRIPENTWWSIPALISSIKQTYPDFQRPAGDYDSWHIRDRQTSDFLRGFAHWDDVDGALIRYMITGPLHWLGILELASPGSIQDSISATAFRYSKWAKQLLNGIPPYGLQDEDQKIYAGSDAHLHVPRLAPRAIRYQIARFSKWEGEKEDKYFYRLTPASLEGARLQGLHTKHLLTILQGHTTAFPPSLMQAIKQWNEYGTEARLESALILRLRTPDMLNDLRASRAARFLGDVLGPTAIIVKPGAANNVMDVLAELGYLGSSDIIVNSSRE